MPLPDATPQCVGGPLDGSTIESDKPYAVVKSPRLGIWDFDYSQGKVKCRLNELRTLCGTYHYERQDRSGKVRYVHIRTE